MHSIRAVLASLRENATSNAACRRTAKLEATITDLSGQFAGHESQQTADSRRTRVQAFTLDEETLLAPPGHAQEGGCSGPHSAVVAVAPHPQLPTFFLAGHSTGLIALHSTASSAAYRSWACGDDLVSVLWLSAGSPAFLAVHRSGAIARMHAHSAAAADVVWVQVPVRGEVVTASTAGGRRLDGPGATLLLGTSSGETLVHALLPLDPPAMDAGTLREQLGQRC